MKYISKKFLSPEKAWEDSSVCCYIEVDTESEYEFSRGLSSSIRVGDCDRFITLEMGCCNEEGFSQKIKKITTFIDELVEFKTQYAHLWDVYKKEMHEKTLGKKDGNE